MVTIRRTFTLFELLLVVAILGIVLGVSFPRLKENIHTFELQAAAKKILLLMDYARTLAILQNDSIEVSINAEEGNIFFQKVKGKQPVSRLVSIPSGMVITGETENVVFYPDGTAKEFNFALQAKSGKSIIFSNNGLNSSIMVSNSITLP